METVEQIARDIARNKRHVCLVGPPGAGKTMIGRSVAGFMGPNTDPKTVKVIGHVRRVASLDPLKLLERPFRARHHTVSEGALVGGRPDEDSALPRYGEVSLAHAGVLFLDDLPEFRRVTLEQIPPIIRTGQVTHGTSHGTVQYPAGFLLVAAMMPCLCGYHGTPGRLCACTEEQICRYRKRVEGILSLVEEIDLRAYLPAAAQEASEER